MPSALGTTMGVIPKRRSQRPQRGLGNQATLELLPAGGRQGAPPEWPFEDQVNTEPKLWAELWRLPQAVAWERLGLERIVARYCRVLVEAECPGWRRETQGGDQVFVESRAITAARQAAINLEDRLGLSPLSMLRLRWAIEGGNMGSADDAEDEVDDVRSRLLVMASGGEGK